jgi:isochorismate synthase
VNLRCARLFNNAAILYAGAGLNSDSNWQLEWKETAEKMAVIGKYLNG